jgi:ATPase
MTVKVPEGMTEADLARPVVVVNDFETKKIEYELYSYGEETVLVPVSPSAGKQTPSKQLASKAIRDEILKYAGEAEVEVTSDHKCTIFVPEKDMARIIGKQGSTIMSIEKKLGIGIDVQPLQKTKGGNQELKFDAEISKKHIIFHVERAFSDTNVNIMLDGDYVMTAHVGREGILKVSKKNKIGKMISDAITNHEKLQILI